MRFMSHVHHVKTVHNITKEVGIRRPGDIRIRSVCNLNRPTNLFVPGTPVNLKTAKSTNITHFDKNKNLVMRQYVYRIG